jgi:L-amino acid N-acyltransferase YncA
MLTIRMADLDDAAGIAAIYRPYVTDAVTSFELDPPGSVEMAGRIQSVLALAPWLVCAGADGHLQGYAYASRHHERAAYRWSVDVAVYISAAHHRRGVGRALYETLFSLLRLQGFYVAHAGITLPNAGSVGLHEAVGFEPIGVYRLPCGGLEVRYLARRRLVAAAAAGARPDPGTAAVARRGTVPARLARGAPGAPMTPDL